MSERANLEKPSSGKLIDNKSSSPSLSGNVTRKALGLMTWLATRVFVHISLKSAHMISMVDG